MAPVDYRNAAFSDLQGRLTGLRLAVYHAWRDHGPGTTREIADRSGHDLLTLRPRTTELVDLGFVVLIGGQGHQGIYRAISMEEAERLHRRRQAELSDPQLCLHLTTP